MNKTQNESISAPENQQGLLFLLEQLERENANKATIENGMSTYLDYKARKKGVPLKATFELTPLCNLDCRMCYVHLSKEQVEAQSRSILSGAQWKQIMQDAIGHGMMSALLTGGEAMMHPDFDELYLYLRKFGIRVAVKTNGLLLTEKRIDFFKRHMPDEVHITLYGADNDTYEKVTGHRVFDQIISNIRNAKAAGIPLRVGVTPSRYMQDGILDAIRLLRSLDVKYTFNPSLADPREETGRSGMDHDLSVKEYIQLYKYMRDLDGAVPESACEGDIPVPGGKVTEDRKGLRCGGGRSSFAVVWDGNMQPCPAFSSCRFDLTQIPFGKAWSQTFKFVSEYPVPRECFGCAFEGFCTVCVVRHEMGAPKGHANPALCERARQFVREGLIKPKDMKKG